MEGPHRKWKKEKYRRIVEHTEGNDMDVREIFPQDAMARMASRHGADEERGIFDHGRSKLRPPVS